MEQIEQNRLIAEFMGYKYFPHPNHTPGWRKEKGHLKQQDYYLARTTKDIAFHRSWNLLMSVVAKICDELTASDIAMRELPIVRLSIFATRSDVYKAVVDYIKKSKHE